MCRKSIKILFAVGAISLIYAPTFAQNSTPNAAIVQNKNELATWGIKDQEIEILSDNAILTKLNFAVNGAKIEQAANSGDANAMYFMGIQSGFGARGDADKAREWYKKAALHNNKFALYALGFEILGSATTLKEGAPGLKYYERAAKLGHVTAMVELGRIYNKGTDLPIPRDMKKSFDYYNRAIELGSEQAKMDIAYAYLEGQGVKVNRQKAKSMMIELSHSKSEIGELARASLMEVFNIDCLKNPNQCK